MDVLSWTIILNTPLERTALKLVDRIERRLDVPMGNVWLRPWGEERRTHALTFDTGNAGDVTGALALAGRLAGAWTILLPGDPRHTGDVLYRAWVPADYRTFVLEGLAEAGFVARPARSAAHPSEEHDGVRRERTDRGTTIYLAGGSAAVEME